VSDDENKTYFLDGMNVLKHNKLILPQFRNGVSIEKPQHTKKKNNADELTEKLYIRVSIELHKLKILFEPFYVKLNQKFTAYQQNKARDFSKLHKAQLQIGLDN